MRAVKTHDASVLVVGVPSDAALARAALDGIGGVAFCDCVADALDLLAARSVDLVIVSEGLPDASPAEFLGELRRAQPGVDFVALCDGYPEDLAPGNEVRGVDVLSRPVDRRALRRLVDQILHRRRLQAESRQLKDKLHVVEACRVLAPCLEAGNIYPVALDLLLNILSRGCGIAVFRRMSLPTNITAAFRGLSDNESGKLRKVLVEDKPLDLAGFSRIEVLERGAIQAILAELGLPVSPVLAVPLEGENGEGGVLFIFEDGRAFEEDELERVRLVASYAESALLNAERYHLAKERAFIDDVTEVYNARYLLSATENELQRAERYGNPLSVLFLDLDRFKLVNDRYGHLVGSGTLRSLSQLLLQCVRQVDTLARYGGDEFTILLVDTDHAEALRIAERIRRTVEEHVFEANGEGSLRLTISIGVGTCPNHGTQRDPLLDAADKAMYRAKSLGRNRICSADELAE